MLDCKLYTYILLINEHKEDVSPANCVTTFYMNLCHNHKDSQIRDYNKKKPFVSLFWKR